LSIRREEKGREEKRREEKGGGGKRKEEKRTKPTSNETPHMYSMSGIACNGKNRSRSLTR